MRALTEKELELVAGGYPTEIVTVTASRIYGDSPPYDGGGGTGGGGGGSGGDPSPPTYEGQPCAIHAIQTDIANMSDHTSLEHAAIVYQDSSGYHTSPVFTGTGDQTPLNALFDWMTQNGIPFSEVTDLYHNHDQASYTHNSDETAVNRYPSIPANGGQDWDAADYFVSHGADANIFKLTVEDTAGVARDFAYSQEAAYKGLSIQQMVSGTNLPGADTGCSG